jgi:hypothetical protein
MLLFVGVCKFKKYSYPVFCCETGCGFIRIKNKVSSKVSDIFVIAKRQIAQS